MRKWVFLTVVVLMFAQMFLLSSAPDISAEGVIGPLPPTPRRTKNPDAKLELANRLIMDQFYNEGIKLIEEYVAEYGVSPFVFKIVSQVVLFSGASAFHKRILAIYKKAGDELTNSGDPESLRAYAMLLLDMNRPDEYLKFYRKCISLSEESMKQVADIAAIPEGERDSNQKTQYEAAQRHSETMRGSLAESVSSYFNVLGLPFIGGDEMRQAMDKDWNEQYEINMKKGEELEKALFLLDALVAYRRASVFADDQTASKLSIARCWLKCKDFENAKKYAMSAGDSQEAKDLLACIEAQKPLSPDTQFYPDLHPSVVSLTSTIYSAGELHAIAVNDKYVAGLTNSGGVVVFDRITMATILRQSYSNTIPEGKDYTDVKRRQLTCVRLLLDGDYLAVCYIDQATKGSEGLIRMFKLPSSEPLADIELSFTLRTLEAVFLNSGHLFAVQAKGIKAWLSAFSADTGKQLWRNSGYDDIICPPIIKDNSVVIGLSSLGMGTITRFNMTSGKIEWEERFDFARIPRNFKGYYGMSSDQAEKYNIPMVGHSDSDNMWVAKKLQDGRIVICAYSVDTGKEVRTINLPTTPAGGFKIGKKYLLFLDENDRIRCVDMEGKQMWSMRNLSMHFFFFFDDAYTCITEVEGFRVISTPTGESVFNGKEIPEAVHVDGMIYANKWSFDLRRDRSKCVDYLEKLFEYGRTLNVGFDFSASAQDTGVSAISPGEQLLRDYMQGNPGIAEVNLYLARLTENQYFSHCKEYATELVHMVGVNAEKMRTIAEEIFPDFTFEWFRRADNFDGAMDEKQYAYTDLGLNAVCLCEENGDVRWKFPLEHSQIHSTVLLPEALVYFFASDSNSTGKMDCYSRKTGKKIWTSNFKWCKNVIKSHYYNGRLYFLARPAVANQVYRADIYCVNPSDGKLLWSFIPVGRPFPGSNSSHDIAFDETGIYFGSTDASVYKLSLESGKVLWQAKSKKYNETGIPDCNFFTVVVRDGKVFTNATDNLVYCFDANNGEQIWMSGIPDFILKNPNTEVGDSESTYWVAAPAAVGGGMFLSMLQYAGRRSIIAFDTNTGEYKWEFRYFMYLCDAILVDEETGCAYVPIFSSGIEKISLADGKLVRHIPLQTGTGYRWGNTMVFTMSGFLIKMKLKR